MKDKNIPKLTINCIVVSDPAATLSRSLGVPMDLYGLLEKSSGDYNTKSILTIGSSKWKYYSFVFHQLNLAGYYYDSAMKYLDDADQFRDKYVISLTWENYYHYIFTDIFMSDWLCSPIDTGIFQVNY